MTSATETSSLEWTIYDGLIRKFITCFKFKDLLGGMKLITLINRWHELAFRLWKKNSILLVLLPQNINSRVGNLFEKKRKENIIYPQWCYRVICLCLFIFSWVILLPLLPSAFMLYDLFLLLDSFLLENKSAYLISYIARVLMEWMSWESMNVIILRRPWCDPTHGWIHLL